MILQVTFKFQVPPTCEISHLIANLVSNLGVKATENGGGSDMLMRGWDRLIFFCIAKLFPLYLLFFSLWPWLLH